MTEDVVMFVLTVVIVLVTALVILASPDILAHEGVAKALTVCVGLIIAGPLLCGVVNWMLRQGNHDETA